jgi:hypothetical protein
MVLDLAHERQRAHAYLDRLPPEQLSAVRSLLETMLDPVARAVATAPPDDEPVTEHDRARFEAGEVWFAERGGTGIPMHEVLAEFGLKPEDFPHSPEAAE